MKRQGQIVAATLNNWETVEKALTAMSNADGSAMKEMEVIMDSVDYKANKLKETFLGIGQDAISRDFLKSILDSATRLIETLSDTKVPGESALEYPPSPPPYISVFIVPLSTLIFVLP